MNSIRLVFNNHLYKCIRLQHGQIGNCASSNVILTYYNSFFFFFPEAMPVRVELQVLALNNRSPPPHHLNIVRVAVVFFSSSVEYGSIGKASMHPLQCGIKHNLPAISLRWHGSSSIEKPFQMDLHLTILFPSLLSSN